MAVGAIGAVAVGVVLATGFLAPPATPSNPAPAPAGLARTVVRSGVGAFAFGDGQLWVDDATAGTLRRVDPARGTTIGPVVHLGNQPTALAVADGRVWVAERAAGTLVAVSTRTHRRVGPAVAVGADPIAVVAAYGDVWVGSLQAGTVTAVDARSGQVVATSALPDGVVRLAAGDGAIWATGQTDTLSRISPHPTGVALSFRTGTVGSGPIGVTVADGAVWTADLSGGTVDRVSPRSLVPTGSLVPAGTARTTGTTAGAGGPETVAVLGRTVWTADYSDAQVTATLASGRPAGTPVKVHGPVTALVAWHGDLWVATTNPGRLLEVTPAS